MDRHELLLCGALILVIVAGVAVRQMRSGPVAEPILIETPDSLSGGAVPDVASADRPASLGSHATSLPSGLKDINLASAIELQQVSGIGPSLSRNILDRDAHGPFQNHRRIAEVSGIGAERLKRLKEQFTVGELAIPPRPEGVEFGSLTGAASPRPQIRESRVTGSDKIDLNAASAKDLETLPGVGPILAGVILEHRERRGPFQSIESFRRSLASVPNVTNKSLPLVAAGGAAGSGAPPGRNLPVAPSGFPARQRPPHLINSPIVGCESST
jgi:competence ComEA-like helix-hairpin-helix protein